MDRGGKYWVGWLGGFSDAEAYVDTGVREIVISNTDKSLLEYYLIGLDELGIHGKIYGGYKHTKIQNAKLMYRLRVQRQLDIRLWAKYIGFISQAKQSRLNNILSIPPKSTIKIY